MSDWNNSGGAAAESWNANASADKWVSDQQNFDDGLAGQHEQTADGRACHNCGEEGHMSRDCPEPQKSRACFNCGEDGHNKADCPNPKVFTGECRNCGEKDKFIQFPLKVLTNLSARHRVDDCPTRTIVCKNCLKEGHEALACTNLKALNNSDIADKTEDEAWTMLKEASKDKDITDFKEAVKILVKAQPDYNYVRLEKEFRKRGFKIFLIAMEKEHGPTWTNVNLQGEIGKTYAVGYYLSDKPQRPNLAPKWPESAEDNLKRLGDAGIPHDRGVDLCGNCDEVGHTSRKCPEEKRVVEKPSVTCALCGEAGHRVRDCTQERQKKREPRTCKNCGAEDHIAKECTVMICRNCEKEGHTSKECTEPKDWSKVTCRNCGEKGHGAGRCKGPKAETDEDAGGNGNGINNDVSADAGGGGWKDESGDTATGDPGWQGTDNGASGWAGGNSSAPVAVGGPSW